MKTIKNAKNEIKRVDDKQAELLVNSENWNYVPKSEWKKIRKFINEDKKEEVVKEKTTKRKKKSKHDLSELQGQLTQTKSRAEKNTIERIIKKEKNK